MKNIIYIVSLVVVVLFCLCGCNADLPLIECQNEISFTGKPATEVQEFYNHEKIKYDLSGGRPESYKGDGVQNNTFSPEGLKPGTHYIYYRDIKNYRQPKRIKIKVTSLVSDPEKCNCDDDYRVKCTNCNATGEVEVQVTCPECDGSGKVLNWLNWFKKIDCNKCQAGQVTERQKCFYCKGQGWTDCDKH